jgi:hypothetical protein
MHQKYFVKVNDFFVENLEYLLRHRSKDKIILLSSNPFRIITAKSEGYLVMPVLPFESFYRDDF